MREKVNSDTQEFGLENKEEKIFDNATEARRQFRNFWRKNNSPEALKKEIKQKEGETTEDLDRQGDYWTLYLERVKPKINKDYNPDELIIVSGNPEKQKGLLKIAESCGKRISSCYKLTDTQEEAIHNDLKKLIAEDVFKSEEDKRGYSSESYSLDVAWSKIMEIYKDNYKECENNPIIASDIVVLQKKNILEKVKKEDEVMDILINKLSGKEVKVSCGVFLAAKTKSGMEFPVYEGVTFTIQLREFSTEDAEEYINSMGQQEKDILNIAGVIDYSNPAAQKLIEDVPVKVEALRLKGHNSDKILISPKILIDLPDYLEGMPEELVKEMLNRQNALSKI